MFTCAHELANTLHEFGNLAIGIRPLAHSCSFFENKCLQDWQYGWRGEQTIRQYTKGSRVDNALIDIPLPSLIEKYRSRDGQFTRWTISSIDVGPLARPPSLSKRICSRVGPYGSRGKQVMNINTFGSRVDNVFIDMPLPSLIERNSSRDGQSTSLAVHDIGYFDYRCRAARPPSHSLREDKSTNWTLWFTR